MRWTIVLMGVVLLMGSAAGQVEQQQYIVMHEPGFDSAALTALDAEIVFDYTIIDGLMVRATPAAVEQMQSFDSITSVQPDIPVVIPVMPGDGDDTDRRSYDGSGVIAVLDTGVDDDHVDLDDRVISNKDVRPGQSNPDDVHGHGTHVASILAGTGEGDDRYRGVAPQAKIRNFKVLDDTGRGDMSTVIKGVEEAADAADVIVMSLGAQVENCDGTDPLSRAVDNAAENGVAVVVAAGNAGPDEESISAPGCAEKAFTVGSSYRGERVSDFSSRGPTADGRVKPDLVAPGENIVAAKAQTSDGYTSKSGTSMAAPYVAGAVAVLMAEKEASNGAYYGAMKETAVDVGGGRNVQGEGNVDVAAARNHLSGEGGEDDGGADNTGGSDSTDGGATDRTGEDDATDGGTAGESGDETPSGQAGEENVARSGLVAQVLTLLEAVGVFVLSLLSAAA